MLGAAPRRHVYKAVVLLVAISAAVLSSNALGSVRAKTAINRPQAKLWAIGVSAPHTSRLSLPRVREFVADGISVIVTSPSGWSSASYRRLADLSVRSGLQLVAPRTDVRSTADRHALSRACHSRVRVPDSCAVMSRSARQARAWIHRGSVRYVVLPVSSPKAFTALRVASTPNTHVIRLIKLPTVGVRTSLPAPVAAAAWSLRPSRGGGGSGGGRKRPDNKPPSVPGGLVVSSAGQTSVALTWRPSTDNVGVVGYGVYRNGKLVASSTSTSYTLTGLTCGTWYSLAVDAYDAAGNRSSRATVTTTAACPVTQSATQPPTAPPGIALGTRTTTSISITWTASTDDVGVAGYDLYAGSSDVGTATATAYTFTGLTCGTSYTLGVDAYDAAGNHSPETTGVFSTSACPDTTPPSTPTGLVVSSAGQTSVALTWNASTDNVGVAGYGVYSNGTLIASSTSTGYTLTGLTCGTSYSVAVDAYDAAGNRSSRATVTTSTVACPDNQRPTAPTGIALGTRTTTSISVTWTASTDNMGVAGYDLFEDPFAGGTQVGTAVATAYTFTGLTCGSSYTVGVDAYDAAGNRSPETTVVLSTSSCPPDTTPPSTPTGLATSGVGQTGATLSWTASGDNVGVNGYRLYQGSTQVGNSATTSYSFTTLSCGTSYTLGVAAVDGAGNVSGTATISAATAPCSASSQFSGTFDCFGSTPNCTGLSPASCSSTITSGLQTALNNAAGGEVICLNSASSFGNISLTNKTYSSTVTVQPTSGVAATIGNVSLNNVDKLRLTGVGAANLNPTSLTLHTMDLDPSSGCSSDITIDHVIEADGTFVYPQYSCSSNMNILFDHNRYDNLSAPGGPEEGRFRVVDTGGGPSANSGVTVSNSHFSGGCSDGIDFAGDPYGTVVGPGNEFTNISQSYSNANCAGSHLDAIQGLGSEHTVIVGNYFHDNGGAGGIGVSDIEPGLVVKNNVVTGSMFYAVDVKGPDTNTYTHNYFGSDVVGDDYVRWDEISNEGSWGGGNLLRNNVFKYNCLSVGATTYTADHNLGSGGTGCDTAGSPVFVSSPASGYYHYQLASTSPGYHAASDGKSMGIAP